MGKYRYSARHVHPPSFNGDHVDLCYFSKRPPPYRKFLLRRLLKYSRRRLTSPIHFRYTREHQNQPCNENLSENCHVHYARDHRN